MSWHFLQEQEEASWAGSSLDGAPSALLSLMPTAAGCCSPDSGTDSCRDSRSGTMCRPSTEGRGGGGGCGQRGIPLHRHIILWARRGHRRQAVRALARNGANRWRSSTPFRVRGKRPNFAYSGDRASCFRLGRHGVRLLVGNCRRIRCRHGSQTQTILVGCGLPAPATAPSGMCRARRRRNAWQMGGSRC